MKSLASIFRAAYGLLLVVSLALPHEVLAQAAPTPSIRNSPKPWMGMILMIVLGMAILGVSLIPSRRGHQD